METAHDATEFDRLYSALADHVADEYERQGSDRTMLVFESAEVVQWTLLGIPKDKLFDLPDDQFIVACYTRLLHRLPKAADVRDWSARLSSGEADRQALVDKILGSSEFRSHRRTVVLV